MGYLTIFLLITVFNLEQKQRLYYKSTRLSIIYHLMTDSRGKFKPNWEGAYLAKKLFFKGVAILSDLEENEFREPINLDKLNKYFL